MRSVAGFGVTVVVRPGAAGAVYPVCVPDDPLKRGVVVWTGSVRVLTGADRTVAAGAVYPG